MWEGGGDDCITAVQPKCFPWPKLPSAQKEGVQSADDYSGADDHGDTDNYGVDGDNMWRKANMYNKVENRKLQHSQWWW